MNERYLEVVGVKVSPDLYVDGKRIACITTFENFSPIDQRSLGTISEAGPQEVDAAIEAALRAFPAWAALGPEKRKAYLDRFAQEIGNRADEFCVLESNDAGVLLSRMRHGVVPRAMLNLKHFAAHAFTLQNRVIATVQANHRVHHDPAGVVANSGSRNTFSIPSGSEPLIRSGSCVP